MKSIEEQLPLLRSIMTLIARQFGENCEVVLHDWSKGYEKSIIAIENGHVTNRKVGDCGSNLGLTVMSGVTDELSEFNYITKTKDGKTIRSSTIYLTDDSNKPIGALCINYDITDVVDMQDIVESLIMVNNKEVNEIFANDVNELLDFLINESLEIVGKPVSEMNKEDKMKALKYLDEKGAFLITKSGKKICKYLDISNFTLYNYLDEIRNGTNLV